MKIIYSGLESSGKSLKLAMMATEIAQRNAKWFRKQREDFDKLGQPQFIAKYGRDFPVSRPIYSNLKFSDDFKTYCEEELLVPIHYWHNIHQLVELAHCDIFIDEVGNYFDSRMWELLSLDARRWLSQAAKTGVEMYGSAQDFAQVDKAFRRLVNHLLLIRKIIGSRRPSATKPPVRRIWGLCMMHELDPNGYDEDKKKFVSNGLVPNFFFITKQYCEIFDTGQKIERSTPEPFQHIERYCGKEDCAFHKTLHV